MAEFGSLPVELIEKIINHLVVEDENAPVIGRNAASTDVLEWYKNRQNDSVPVNSLKNLRLTCRYLNQICIPILFQELNLLTYRQVKHFSAIQELILVPYAGYVQVLRLAIGRRFPADSILAACYNIRSLSLYFIHGSVEHAHLVPPILRLLQFPKQSDSLTSNNFDNSNNPPGKEGQLTSLGLYYQNCINGSIDPAEIEGFWKDNSKFNVPAALLSSILDDTNPSTFRSLADGHKVDSDRDSSGNSERSPEADGPIDPFSSIQILDFVAGPLPLETFESMQAKLGGLKTLTILHGLDRGLRLTGGVEGSIWDPMKEVSCSFRPTLTSLSLRDCDGIEAFDVPSLVQYFPALTDLAILACGNLGIPRVERPRGWSSPALSGIALGQTRILNTLRIEHMEEEEIMSMGIVPTHTLCIISRQLIKILARDSEIFPGMKVLRTYAGTKQDPVEAYAEASEEEEVVEEDGRRRRVLTLDRLCEARDIELRFDLPNYIGCGRDNCIYV